MERAVFDTNILIDFSHSNEQAQEVIKFCRERLISVVTWIEFLTGIPEPRLDQAKAFLEDMFEVIYPDEIIYDITLDLRRQKRLKLPDATIYATAKSIGAPLVTRNTKDFDRNWADIDVPYQ